MLPEPAQYLLRFDDLCPSMDAEKWLCFQALIERFELHPLLAIVPDNMDQSLNVAPADPHFWQRMRYLEAAGATIALHGYQHLCLQTGRSLIPLHKHSEFAGADRDLQLQWIRAGLSILRGQQLNPRVWVAPRHGFDGKTVEALRAEGIQILSDGFGQEAYKNRGMVWIPQQLWEPQERQRGLWTICIHSNYASEKLIRQMEKFLEKHASQCTSVDRILREHHPGRRSFTDLLAGWEQLSRYKMRQQLRKLRRTIQRRRLTSEFASRDG
jgi:predicted deacetylase